MPNTSNEVGLPGQQLPDLLPCARRCARTIKRHVSFDAPILRTVATNVGRTKTRGVFTSQCWLEGPMRTWK